MIFAELIANLSLLIAGGAIYGLVAYRRHTTSPLRIQIFAGFLFGSVAILGMLFPFTYVPGIIFDGRSVLLSIAGLFGGPVTAVIAAAIASIYRLWLGGGGAVMGVGVISTSAILGVGLYYRVGKRPHLVTTGQIYALGLVVHASMLLWMFSLPWPSAVSALRNLSLPVIVAFPLATLLLGKLLADMAGRYETQKQLRTSSDRYASIVATQTELVDHWLPDGTLIFVNAAYCRYYGKIQTALLGRNWLDFVVDEDKSRLKAYVRQLSTELTPANPIQTNEHREVVAGGKIRWTRWVDRGIFDDRGVLKEFQSTGQDITERKSIEQKLRINEQRLVTAQDVAGIGNWELDLKTGLVWASANAFAIYGLNLDLKKDPQQLLPIDRVENCIIERDRIHQALDSLIADNAEYNLEYDIIREADGKRISIHSIAKQLCDESGTPRTIMGTIQDITERKQAEAAAKAEKDRAQAYLDIAAVAMVALDTEGRITLINRQGRTILGFSKEELLGKNWFETCIPARLRTDVSTVFEQLMAGRASLVEYYENPILTKDGEERIIAWHNALLFDDEGTITGTLSSGQDITERIYAVEEKLAMETHLRQAQKLESIGTLASGVAHEINNPLMGMMNYAELVKDAVQDPKAAYYLAEIGNEGNRIAKIVRNLLSFSRQDKEEHSLAEIADIIDRSLSLVGSLLRKDQIILELDIPDDLPSLKCRNQQIQQVMINLLTNARDALNVRYPEYDEDKILRITARVFEKENEDWIRTTVEDHGAGISEDVVQRIFDPFFTTKSRHEGTGLGLSISFGIVREHHGELNVETVLGKTTRFHMDLRVNNGWNHRQPREEVS